MVKYSVTHLGHAGFCVETPSATVVMDPWLSATGAFDAAWFQLPCNHHLADVVQAKLARDVPLKFVYVSHEHEDHFDLSFLESLRARDFTLLVPRYKRNELRRILGGYRCKEVRIVDDAEIVPLGDDGYLAVYIDDSELNRDSALLVRTGGVTFLDLNDCRIYDRLREIQNDHGRLDVVASQYSGASWHPTCYAYSQDAFEEIAQRKVLAKFSTVASMLEATRPAVYLATAGPAVFLDPALIDLNFRPNNLFPRVPRLLEYLEPVLARTGTRAPELMPGDRLDLQTLDVAAVPERMSDRTFEAYVRAYADGYDAFFAERRAYARSLDLAGVHARVRAELERKLAVHALAERIDATLYFGIDEVPGRWLAVRFRERRIDEVAALGPAPYYRISAPAGSLAAVLDGEVTWEEFGLSLRARLDRDPDVYQPLIHAYITLEAGDLVRFCSMTIDLENRSDRIEVEAGGRTYSVLRYCPHNGGDLAEGSVEDDRYLICPRHKWRFDLRDGGSCTTSGATLKAIETTAKEPEVV